MKFTTLFTLLAALFASSNAFVTRPAMGLRVQRSLPSRAVAPAMKEERVVDLKAEAIKLLPAAAALSLALPANAEGMSGAMLPPIMVPLVGLIFPGVSMALFFLYSQGDEV